MKTIGLIGGMSWVSSLEYYRIINERINTKLGGLHSAKIIMISLDFKEILNLADQNKWLELEQIIIDAAKKLENDGADFIVLCCNTIHKIADAVQNTINIPLLHITDATAEKIKEANIKKVGLLGSKFTMEEDFYKKRLRDKYNLDVLVPSEEERKKIDNIIFKELCVGDIKKQSKKEFINIINNLLLNGAEAIILGCTEIPSLIKQPDVKVLLFDTTQIHAESAADFALHK